MRENELQSILYPFFLLSVSIKIVYAYFGKLIVEKEGCLHQQNLII